MNEECKAKGIASVKRANRRRCLYLLLLVLLIIALPLVYLPVWLESKGIEIRGISGVEVTASGIQFQKLSISIHDNLLDFHQLEIQKTKQTTTSSSPYWHLNSKEVEIGLAPHLLPIIQEQGLNISALRLFDTELNLNELASPKQFPITARHASATLTNLANGSHHLQKLSDIKVIISTKPDLVIRGLAQSGKLQLFIPNAANSPRYLFHTNEIDLSIHWLKDSWPLVLAIKSIKQESVESPQEKYLQQSTLYIQQANYFTLAIDMLQPGNSLTLSAERLDIGKHHPLASKQTHQTASNARTSAPLHLGKAIAAIAALPIRQVVVQDFSLPPTFRHIKLKASKDTNSTWLALNSDEESKSPIQFEATLTTTHATGQVNATFSGPSSSHVSCKASLTIAQPLPDSANCRIEIDNTKSLSTLAGLNEVPELQLDQPITLQFQKTRPEQYLFQLDFPKVIPVDLKEYAIALAENPESHIELRSEGNIKLLATVEDEITQVQLNQPLKVAVKAGSQPASVNGYINSLQCQITPWHCRITAQLATHAAQLKFEGGNQFKGQLEDLSAQTRLTAAINDKHLELELRESKATAKTARLDSIPNLVNSQLHDVQISANQLKLTRTWQDDAGLSLLQPSGKQASLIGSAGYYTEYKQAEFTEPDSQQNEKASIEATAQVQTFQGRITVSLTDFTLRQVLHQLQQPPIIKAQHQIVLTANLNNQELPSLGTEGELSWSDQGLRLNGILNNTRLSDILHYEINTDLPVQSYQIKLATTPLSFSPKRTLQTSLLKLPITFDLNSGDLAMAADLTFTEGKWQGIIRLHGDKLSGYIKDLRFNDVSFAINANVTPEGIISQTPFTFNAGLMHYGFFVRDLAASLNIDTSRPYYRINQAYARVFDGIISTRAVTISDLNHTEEIPVRVSGLKISKVIEETEYQGIEVTGTLDGLLPFSFVDSKVAIKDGELSSRPPGGILRYLEDSAIDRKLKAAGNRNVLSIAMILKNYTYDSVVIDIDFSTEGILNAGLRFKGRNPDFQQGRQVNLNLNIQDDIPALVKTIQTINATQLEAMFLKQLDIE